MNDIFLPVPPLKTTQQTELRKPLAIWLDDVDGDGAGGGSTGGGAAAASAYGSHPNDAPVPSKRPDFRSVECMNDLEKLESIRYKICDAIPNHHSHRSNNDSICEAASSSLSAFYDYHSMLVEFESRNVAVDEASAPLQLQWTSSLLQYGSDASSNVQQTHSTLTWERANILYNIVVLEAYLASKEHLNNKLSWSNAGLHLEKSATIIRHLRNNIVHMGAGPASTPDPTGKTISFSTSCIDFSSSFLLVWESFLTADAQKAAYEAFGCSVRPRHFMLAKLAAGAVPLFQKCEQLCNETELVAQIPLISNIWRNRAKAWAMYMKCRSEYHQACTHKDKRQWALEHARLNHAIQFADRCLRFLNSQPQTESSHPTKSLLEQLNGTSQDLQDRLVESRQTIANENIADIPKLEDLPEIPPQMQVNVNKPLEKILPPPATPLFQDIMSPLARRYINLFITEMQKLVGQMTTIAEEKTESARKALATVNLPHSLTAYRQEQAGGGIPEELWRRIQTVQRERKISQLKQDLWELNDIAESARITYKHVEDQLEDNLRMDSLFREQHPSFEGHDASEVQKTFRNSLQNYDRLLVTALDGDKVLLRRLKMLDTDPKYKLLQFQKSQLDRLLPGTAGAAPMASEAIDTSVLSRLLVELSTLFREREVFIKNMKNELKNYDIHSRVSHVDLNAPDAEKELQRILVEAKESFNHIAMDIQDNITRQRDLVRTILAENQNFMKARDNMQSSSSSDSCIVMIEDAIEEIEQLSKHLREGKDFYDVVIPKLEKLQTQVGDVSARLTVERCEYEEKASLNRQEEEDARMAASMGANNNSSSGGGHSGSTQHHGSHNSGGTAQPGVEQVSHDEPQVRVDDEKVASLVAMDFDPEKVVAALKKYDNDMDHALNELLSC